MSELFPIRVSQELQHTANNDLLAKRIEELLSPECAKPEDPGFMAYTKHVLSDGTEVELDKLAFFGGDFLRKQPLTIKIKTPFEGNCRQIEKYSFMPEHSRRKGEHYTVTSSASTEFLRVSEGSITIPTLGHAALKDAARSRLFASIRQRIRRRKEYEVFDKVLSIEMDNYRTARLLSLLYQCDEENRMDEEF